MQLSDEQVFVEMTKLDPHWNACGASREAAVRVALGVIRAQADARINGAASGAQSEAHPVAWMTDDGIVASDREKRMNTGRTIASSFTIPLYANPTVADSRAQAEAQPVAWQYRSHGSGHWMTTTKDVHDDYRDRGITECRELFIHPSAELCRADDVSRKPRLDTAEMQETRITETMTRLDEAKAEAKELRHALSIARDHMRVMANWIKRRDDPVAYDWATDAITIVNAVLERGKTK